jgi:hypothetical protein
MVTSSGRKQNVTLCGPQTYRSCKLGQQTEFYGQSSPKVSTMYDYDETVDDY